MPKLVDHASYRKQLLAQCLDLFAHYGYSALTMRQVAEALHVSTGTLYHYFPTKEALFQRLVEEVTQQTAFEAASAVQQQETLEERLKALCQFMAEHEDSFQKQFLITLNYYQHRDVYGNEAGEMLKKGGMRYRQVIMDLVGLHDPQLCFLLQSQMHGLLITRMINGNAVQPSFLDQMYLFIDMLLDHIRKASPSYEGDSSPEKEDV